MLSWCIKRKPRHVKWVKSVDLYRFDLTLTLYAPTPQMVKHAQAIRRLTADKVLSVFDHFVALALKGLPLGFW